MLSARFSGSWTNIDNKGISCISVASHFPRYVIGWVNNCWNCLSRSPSNAFSDVMLPSATTVPSATWKLSCFNVNIGVGSALKSASMCPAVNVILGISFFAVTAEKVGISTERVPAKVEPAPSTASVASTSPSSSMSSPKNGSISARFRSKSTLLFQGGSVSP